LQTRSEDALIDTFNLPVHDVDAFSHDVSVGHTFFQGLQVLIVSFSSIDPIGDCP
jgi:hypothetical protein